MNRVHRDISIAVAVGDVDDYEVVDVLHVGADLGLGEALFDGGVDDDVAGGAVGDFVADVGVEVELAVGPFYFDLRNG